MNEFLWKNKLAVFLGLADIHVWVSEFVYCMSVRDVLGFWDCKFLCVKLVRDFKSACVCESVLDCLHGLVKSGFNLYFW